MTNIAAERHTLWLRFSVMVVVHAFILRGLWTAIHETGKHPIGPLMLVLAWLGGLALCAMWFGLIWRAWTILRVWEDIAKRFSWSGLNGPESNPFRALEKEREEFRGKYSKLGKILRSCFKTPGVHSSSNLSGTLERPKGRKIKERTASDDVRFREKI